MKTCFTTIFKRYDTLKPPKIVSEGWEYIVFTDEFIDVPPWRCVITTSSNREIKILCKDMFCNLTLYVDGSIEIIGDLNKFIRDVPTAYTARKHRHRHSVAEECEAVIRIKGCDPEAVKIQVGQYGAFPDNMGLAECGVLLRDLNETWVRKVNSMWWSGFVGHTGRDQLTFMQVFWVLGRKPDLFGNDVFNKYFILHQHDKATH